MGDIGSFLLMGARIKADSPLIMLWLSQLQACPSLLPQAFVFLLEKIPMSHGSADSSLKTPWWGIKKCVNAPPQDSIIIALDYEWSPFFLRESRASETQARLKITSLEKGKTQRGERKMGDYRPRLVNLCIPLTTQNSYWLFHGNLSTSVKNAPAAIDTRHNHYFQNK